jgi:hypothetical protein
VSLGLLAVAVILALSLSCIEFNCTLYTTETIEKDREEKGREEWRGEWRGEKSGQKRRGKREREERGRTHVEGSGVGSSFD